MKKDRDVDNEAVFLVQALSPHIIHFLSQEDHFCSLWLCAQGDSALHRVTSQR